MYPGTYAQTTPDKPAVIMATSGESLTFAQLNDRSNQLAQLLHAAGLRAGDHVSIFMENRLEYFVCYWAAVRSGLYFTTINQYLQPEEAAYILDDSNCKAVFSSRQLVAAAELPSMTPDIAVWLRCDGAGDGYQDFDAALSRFPAERLVSQPRGESMLYSSGTTGRPKGIKRKLSGFEIDDPQGTPGMTMLLTGLFGFNEQSVYLSPAPMYHSAPLGFTVGVQSLGGTCVVMEKFDPGRALQLIDEQAITHSQWVPTMFGRMLRTDEQIRADYDGSTHQVAIHAAAPCPVEIKKQMFELWGPIIFEYYAGTELNGFVFCTPDDWLEHPGTVGKSILGAVHICDEMGDKLPPGESGTIFFEREEMPFEYHNDPGKTKGAQHPTNPTWSTLGDVGFLDEAGYLYLTDRKAFMIISGGVNIYPQEIEDCLIVHPKVADVAVIGVPNADMGEEVKAVVQPEPGFEPSEQLAQELITYSRGHLANYKLPRTIDFRDELPRLPTGKLYKRLLRDEYWGKRESRIV